MTTPIGGGIRSLNVTLRQVLDLYACVRPCRYIPGVPSPVKEPQKLDVVIFRENTEDVYAGIEWPAGSQEATAIIDFISGHFSKQIRPDSGIGIKPISLFGTKRLVRMAIRHALEQGPKRVTIVHKGNIMKFTEGAFRDWGYQVAREEFKDFCVDEAELWEKHGGHIPDGKILVNDRIADAMFQQVLLRPDEYQVLVTPNLNGDYLSDACAAQIGGLGMAPGANIGDQVAFFEATHGTAPKYAGQDKVNPGIADSVRRHDARVPGLERSGGSDLYRAREDHSAAPSHVRPRASDGGCGGLEDQRVRIGDYREHELREG